MVYALADRLGESDPRNISRLPAEILLHWQAYFELLTGADRPPVTGVVAGKVDASTSQQCADIVRILGQ